jgi:hypothetical protein
MQTMGTLGGNSAARAAATSKRIVAQQQTAIMPPSMRTENPFHRTTQEAASPVNTQMDKREAQRTAARTLRLMLTARACRRINTVLQERKQAAARRADRA